MKRVLLLLMAACLIIGFVFIAGCSDDDEGTKPVVKEVGDPDAPELEAVGVAYDFAEDMNSQFFGLMFELIDSVLAHPDFPGVAKYDNPEFATGIATDSFYLTYHTATDYWYAYVHSVDTIVGDTDQTIMTFTLEDSVQFLHGTEAVQWPDSALVTGINSGVSMLVSTDDLGQVLAAHQRVSIVGDIPSNGDVVINGNASIQADFSGGGDYGGPFCTFGINLTSTYTDVNLNLTNVEMGGCPTSGTAVYTGAINMACVGDTSFTYNDNWSITETFAGTTIHYVVENSTTRWEFDEMCYGVMESPDYRFSEILDRLR